MIKLNILALTLMISVRKRDVNSHEFAHKDRIRKINEQNLDRRAQIRPYM